MHRRMRQVEEKGPPLRLLDKPHRLSRALFHDRRLHLVGQQFGDCLVTQQRHDPLAGLGRHPLHVIGIGNAVVAIEALAGGEKLGLVAEMPLPDACCGIAEGLQPFCDRDLGGIESLRTGGKVDPGHADPHSITAGEQLRPRHRADRRRVEARELHPFGRHAVEVGGLLLRGSEWPDVAIAQVVDEDHDDVRRGRGTHGAGRCHEGHQTGHEAGQGGGGGHGAGSFAG